MSHLLLLVPFAALILANLLPRSARPAATGIALGVLALQTVAVALPPLGLADWSALNPVDTAIGLHVSMDNLSVLLLVSAGLAGMASIFAAGPGLKTPRERFLFANLVLVALIGINGISMVRDLFSLYVFIEVTAIATFILVVLRHGVEAYEGAWKYVILSAVASVLMLASIALFILVEGGVSLSAITHALASPGPIPWIATALFLCGLFIKGGLVPFHGWLADAYSAAPAPSSIFMAGIVTKASGVFALMRLSQSVFVDALPTRWIFLVVGAVTLVIGAFLALTQSDMKRMLAYSSVSQIGYIVLALGGSPQLGIVAAALHFFNHAVSKSQLFANAQAIEEQLGTISMDRMGGLGSRMPVTAGTSAVASLSIAGLPPLAGFWSKLLIVIALWQVGQYVFAAIAILTSLVTLGYFLSLQRRVFFGVPLAEWANVREVRGRLLTPALALSLITVAVGLVFPLVLSLLLGGSR
ncbi:MAG TPA: proton-conducting transporter membrane subunit [Spirochaetia bacterium]|nr:proton-conducting transporter membrane subunit [Spirochaetia bacterium]